MGCRSDYLEQTGLEAGLQEAGKLLEFAYDEANKRRSDLGARLVPASSLSHSGVEYYAKDVGQVQALCALLQGLKKKDLEAIVYDAHNPTSRQLATWWEKHQEADHIRLAEERRQALQAAALAKLTEEERAALGL